MKLLRLLLVATILIGSYACATWAFVFWHVIRDGQYIVYEPVGWIIRAEFWLASAMAIFSLVVLTAICARKEELEDEI